MAAVTSGGVLVPAPAPEAKQTKPLVPWLERLFQDNAKQLEL